MKHWRSDLTIKFLLYFSISIFSTIFGDYNSFRFNSVPVCAYVRMYVCVSVYISSWLCCMFRNILLCPCFPNYLLNHLLSAELCASAKIEPSCFGIDVAVFGSLGIVASGEIFGSVSMLQIYFSLRLLSLTLSPFFM